MKVISLIIRTLLVGLFIHFVVLTRLEYRLGLTGSALTIIALWKEIVLVGWTAWLGWTQHKHIKQLRNTDTLFRISTLVLFGTLALTMMISAGTGYALSSYIAAAKYNLVGFGVGWLAYISGTLITRGEGKSLSKRYIRLIKIALILSFVRYAAIVVKPGILKYLGYSKYTYEGSLDKQPPAVYYSEMTSGMQRNQFVFERPITYGFWLVAFWPLFFIVVLRRQPFAESWLWWLMYTIAVIFTYSRAARGAWLVQIAILGYRTYQNTFKQFARKILLPAIIVVAGVGYLGFHEIFGGGRQFSNTGHISALITSIHAIGKHPLFGRGPGSVGPASHHFGLGYNTENQFLQVIIEYGAVGFIGWLVLFTSIIAGGVRLWTRKPSKESDYLIAYSIGMMGIALSGLVLHSWVDRMVVRPMMILIGMSWGVYINHNKNNS